MKKLKIFALLGFLVSTIAVFASCSGKELAVPSGFSVDDTNRLTWTEVEDARRYKISITNTATGEVQEYNSNRDSYSLAGLEEGDYEIKIMAISGKDEDKNSDWSPAFLFHKDYETGCVYTLVNNSEYEITRVGTASGTVVIEDEYKGKPVTRIADNAFKASARVENIVLGKNIVSIGNNAFYGCRQLLSITLPESLQTIGSAAFSSCNSLKTIEIPDRVTVLEKSTFAYCKGLESITLSSNLKTIGEQAFRGCSSLKKIEIPDSVTEVGMDAFASNGALNSVEIGAGVTTIGENAFFQNTNLQELIFAEKSALKTVGSFAFSECSSLTSVTFPEGLEDLGAQVFDKATLLESVGIPDTVMHVGKYAFSDTKLYNDQADFIYADKWLVGIDEEIRLVLSEINYNELIQTVGADKKEVLAEFKEDVFGIADNVFANCAKLTSVRLPATIKAIGHYAFYNNSVLNRVIMQDNSVEVIGNSAFRYCKVLTRLTLSEGLETIGERAFADCTLLDNNGFAGDSMIPSTVRSIGTEAFKNTALWSKPDASGVVYAGNWVVGYNKASLGAIALKTDTAGVADYAFYNCTSLSSVTGLSYVEHIGRGAFYGCSGLLTVVLNQNLTRIEDYTFYKCSSLVSFGMPVGLTSIGRSAFYKCERLESIDLSVCAVETIDPYAFYGCASVSSVDLGSSLSDVGEYAFYKCAKIEKLVLPDSLETIGKKAYAKCEGLKELSLGGVETIGDYAFQGCGALESITVPASVKTIGNYAFYKCVSATDVTFENGVEKIGDYAFYNLANVQELVLPDSVKTIGKYAFKGWSSLTSLVLKHTVEDIGAHAFYGAKEITVYTSAQQDAVAWAEYWNSSYRPVVWGCTLSEDNSYVVSVTIDENSFSNETAQSGVTAPERAGYVFVGWSTESGSKEIAYTLESMLQAPLGTTLYAVWEEYVEVETPETSDTPEIPETSEENTEENASDEANGNS